MICGYSPLRRRYARFFLLGWMVLGLIGADRSSSNGTHPQRVTLQGVPFVPQLPNYCGPAALSGIFAYWDRPIEQSSIGRSVYDRRYDATNGADLLYFALKNGFTAYTTFSSPEELKGYLRSGIPVVVLQHLSRGDKRGHFRTVIGYSDITRSFLIRDSNYEKVQRPSYEEFDRLWSGFKRWALVICPRDHEAALPESLEKSVVNQLDLGQAYYRLRKDREAMSHFKTALELEPGNEEALEMLARIDRDGKPSRSGAVAERRR